MARSLGAFRKSSGKTVTVPSVRGGTAWALGGATLLAVALRLPFLAAGVGQDEGGYAYVAQPRRRRQ
jgi:hypothetical protein